MKKILALLVITLLIVSPSFASEPAATYDTQAISTQPEPLSSTSSDDMDCPEMASEFSDELMIAQGGCCKTCRKGKACGDSCINQNYNCSRPKGCACDG